MSFDAISLEDTSTLMLQGNDFYKDHRKRLYNRIINQYKDMSDQEILEVILFVAHARADTKPIAISLLNEFNTLANVVNADESALLRVKGIGMASIAALRTIKYACMHITKAHINKDGKMIVDTWDEMLNFFRATIGHQKEENILLVFMNTNNKILGYEVHKGTINKVIIYPREIVKRGLELGSSIVILVHNHPNNNPRPSQSDVSLTIKLKKTLADIEIDLYDHVIISPSKHFSFKKAGLL